MRKTARRHCSVARAEKRFKYRSATRGAAAYAIVCLGLSAGCGGATTPSESGATYTRPSWCELHEEAMAELESPPPGVLALTKSVTQPELISTGKPIYYPLSAFKMRARGPVRARCVITEAGVVEDCRILEAPPRTELSIVRSLESRRYRPARRGDQPVAVYQPFDFVLEPPSVFTEEPPSEVMPDGLEHFDERQMTRPAFVSGFDPVYTTEALAARIEGTFVASCVLTTEGTITNCHVIRPLPFLVRSSLFALSQRRYTPVFFREKAVAVRYVFNLNFVLPSRESYATECLLPSITE